MNLPVRQEPEADLVRDGARLSGAVADLRFQVDAEEHARRIVHEFSPPKDVAALDYAIQNGITAFRPPGKVVEVRVAATRASRSVFERAVRFRHVAPVTVVVQWMPTMDVREIQLEADALGLGLIVVADEVEERLLDTPGDPGDFDAGVWRFLETAYAAWCVQRGVVAGTG